MPKKILILVVSSQNAPYEKMWQTQKETWDSIEVDGVETVFYFGEPLKSNTDKEIYFDIREGYANMGYKLLDALNWSLQNKEFDYIARINSSTYCNKKELVKYIQNLSNKNVYEGLKVDASENCEAWIWGCFYILSKDVVQKLVDNQLLFEHNKIEDMGLSHLANKIGIPLSNGKGCSIDKMEFDKWRCVCYGSESYEFLDFSEIKKDNGQFFFRVKYDSDRNMDKFIMEKLFGELK